MQAIKDIIPVVVAQLQTPKKSLRSRLLEEWPAIAGPRLAHRTRPRLGEEGELCVWVDQSTLAFELSQRYRQSFLKRVQAALGEKAVTSIRFRVGRLNR